jgi:hypothetical protein
MICWIDTIHSLHNIIFNNLHSLIFRSDIMEASWFEIFYLLIYWGQFIAGHWAQFQKMPRFDSIPPMKRKSIGTKVHLFVVLLDKVHKWREMRIKIFIPLINFHIRTDVLFNTILQITLSVFEIIVYKMRIIHNLFQEMRSIDASTDEHRSTLNYFVGRGSKFVLEFIFTTLVLHHWSILVYNYSIFMWFYIKMKSLIGTFHINWASIRLIQRWPIIPLLKFLWLERSYVFGRLLHDMFHVKRLYLLLTMLKIGVDHSHSLISRFDVSLSGVNIFVSKP